MLWLRDARFRHIWLSNGVAQFVQSGGPYNYPQLPVNHANRFRCTVFLIAGHMFFFFFYAIALRALKVLGKCAYVSESVRESVPHNLIDEHTEAGKGRSSRSHALYRGVAR